jgi:hypothetical protein
MGRRTLFRFCRARASLARAPAQGMITKGFTPETGVKPLVIMDDRS